MDIIPSTLAIMTSLPVQSQAFKTRMHFAYMLETLKGSLRLFHLYTFCIVLKSRVKMFYLAF